MNSNSISLFSCITTRAACQEVTELLQQSVLVWLWQALCDIISFQTFLWAAFFLWAMGSAGGPVFLFWYVNRSVWCEIGGSHIWVPVDSSLLGHWASSSDISVTLCSFETLVIINQLTGHNIQKLWIFWGVWSSVILMHGSQIQMPWSIHYFSSTFFHTYLW